MEKKEERKLKILIKVEDSIARSHKSVTAKKKMENEEEKIQLKQKTFVSRIISMHKALRKCLIFQVDLGFIIANCAAQLYFYFYFRAFLCLCRGRLFSIRAPAMFCTLSGTNAPHGVIKETSCGAGGMWNF